MGRSQRLWLSTLLLGITLSGNAAHDPTRPMDPALYFGNSGKESGKSWSLQSILRARDRRVAVINGERVREGDRIGSAEVVRIDDSRVLIKTGGRMLTLYLLPETLKVRP